MDACENLPISVIFADANGLKLTNDIFGHSLGDEMIRTCARVLVSCCRESDVVARVGGDEFAILLARTQSRDAQAVIERIRAALAAETVGAVRLSMAFGCDTKISLYQNIVRIMENAEIMMYKDKSLTRRSFGKEAVDAVMCMLCARSPREKAHAESVAALCVRLSRALGLTETQTKKIRDAGYLHDIGKIVLRNDLLARVSPLTERDKKEILQHAAAGYRLLNLFDDTLDLAEGVYAHHERWNGEGFPKGLRGDEIPREARIIAIAEAYDSMVNPAGGRPLTQAQALERIRKGAGVKFDPDYARAFLGMMAQDAAPVPRAESPDA